MNNKMGYFIIVIGLMITVLGVVVVNRSQAAQKAEVSTVAARKAEASTVAAQKIETVIHQPIQSKVQPIVEEYKKDVFDENKEKGDAFERFVVRHFNKKYFTLQEWRSDKYVDGHYPVSNHFPDLEINFTLKRKNINDTFAIECKWRKDYYKDAIQWASDYQIRNYGEYADKLNIPVFVVIGVGGEPENPNEVFIIPLHKLNSNTISYTMLRNYKREIADEDFFWEFETNVLR